MTFLPIVDRELRVRARHPGTYKARGIGALLAVGVTFVLLMFGATGANAGASAFSLLSFLAFAFCLLDGLRNTADCLSEEKRAGTLGFLFLTDLKGYDVVLGKMIAASLNSFYVLIAVLPAFALPLLAGGVTPGEFWRLVLVLLETLLFSLALGILVSSASRDETSAWLGSVGLIIAWTVVPLVIRSVPFIDFPLVDWLSPSVAFATLREAAYKAEAEAFWKAAAGTGLLSVIFVAAASWILPRAWQDHPREASPLTRDMLPQATRAGNAADKRVLNENPIVWLTSRRQTHQQIYLWMIVCLGGSFAVVASLGTPGWTVVTFAFIAAAVVLHLVLAALVAFNACYLLSDAKNSGALELLFSTPLKPHQIVDGFLLGLKRRFFWPVVTLLWVEVALLIARVLSVEPSVSLEAIMVFLVAGAVIVMFVMDLYAVAIFGFWTALHTKKAGQAFARTVTLVLILPTLLGVCCVVLPITGILKNMIFLSYRQALYDKFRRMISEPHASAAPVFASKRSAPPKLPSVLD